MHIRDIYVDGFGHFADFSISGISEGMTVLFGPNEAGKTTLVNHLEYVLYGTEPYERSKPRALAGGRLGGHLTLVDSSGAVLTVQRLDNKLTVHKNNRIVASTNTELTNYIKISRHLFRAVFAFELADLTGLDSLTPRGSQSFLLAGALIGAGTSAATAGAQLTKQRDTLWKPRARSVIGDLEKDIEELENILRAAEREAGEFLNLQREIRDLEEARADHERKSHRHLDEAHRWETYTTAYPHHIDLELYTTQLEGLPPSRPIAPELGPRHSALTEERTIQQVHLTTALSRLEDAETAHDHIKPNTLKLQYKAEINQLADDASTLGRESLQHATERRDALRNKLTEALRRVGTSREDLPRWSAGEVAALKRAADEAVKAEEARASVKAHELAVTRSEESVAEHTTRRDAVHRDLIAEELTPRIEALDRDASKRHDAHRQERDLERDIAPLRREVADAIDLDSLPDPKPNEREHFSRDVADWQARHNRARAALGIADEQARAAREDLIQAKAAKTTLISDPSAAFDADLYSKLESTVEQACAAHARAHALNEKITLADTALDRILDELGPWWSTERAAEARTDTTHRTALTKRAQALDAACRDRADAERAPIADVTEPPISADALRARLNALNHADTAFREYDELRARVKTSPPRTSLLTVLAIMAVVLLAIGAVAIVEGALLSGVLVLLVALALGIVAWMASARGRDEAPGEHSTADVSDRRKRASAAFREAGLPEDATPAAISKVKADVEAQRQEAERLGVQAGAARQAKQRLDDAVAHELAERAAWQTALTEAGFDPELDTSDLELVRNRLMDFQTRRRERDHDKHELANARQIWNIFPSLAAPMASAVSQPLSSPAEARKLMHTLRLWSQAQERQDRASDACRDTQRAANAKQKELDAIIIESESLDAMARHLGVPPEVDIEEGPNWLQKAERLKEQRAHLDRLERDQRQHARIRDTWDAELMSIAEALGLTP
ncbi:MAG: AAA family ATPase, partial [Bradymonadaceae bacterium]